MLFSVQNFQRLRFFCITVYKVFQPDFATRLNQTSWLSVLLLYFDTKWITTRPYVRWWHAERGTQEAEWSYSGMFLCLSEQGRAKVQQLMYMDWSCSSLFFKTLRQEIPSRQTEKMTFYQANLSKEKIVENGNFVINILKFEYYKWL